MGKRTGRRTDKKSIKAAAKLKPEGSDLTAQEIVALDLFVKGNRTYQAIADEMGIGVASAHRIVRKAVQKRFSEISENIDQWIVLQVQNLLKAVNSLEPAVMKGDARAVDSAVRVLDRLSKLLGLDKPTKIAPTDPSGEMSYFELGVDERAELIDSILDLARARRTAQARGDRPVGSRSPQQAPD